MMRKLILLVSVSMLFSLACSPREQASGVKTPTPKPADPVKEQMRAFKNADFDYIFIFKRKDGMKMDSDDKQFIKNNSHPNTNRFTLSKDEKIIFAGSNFKFPDAGLTNLKDRFEVDDRSKSEEQIERQKERRKDELEREKVKSTRDDTPRKSNRTRFIPESEKDNSSNSNQDS